MQNEKALPYAVYQNGALVARYLTYPQANGHVLEHGKIGRIYDATDWRVVSALPYLVRALVTGHVYGGKALGSVGAKPVAVFSWGALDDLIRRTFEYTSNERPLSFIVNAQFSDGSRHCGVNRLQRASYTAERPALGCGRWLFPGLCATHELSDVRCDWPDLSPGSVQ